MRTYEEIESKLAYYDQLLGEMRSRYNWLKRFKRNSEEVVRIKQDMRLIENSQDALMWVLGINK